MKIKEWHIFLATTFILGITLAFIYGSKKSTVESIEKPLRAEIVQLTQQRAFLNQQLLIVGQTDSLSTVRLNQVASWLWQNDKEFFKTLGWEKVFRTGETRR